MIFINLCIHSLLAYPPLYLIPSYWPLLENPPLMLVASKHVLPSNNCIVSKVLHPRHGRKRSQESLPNSPSLQIAQQAAWSKLDLHDVRTTSRSRRLRRLRIHVHGLCGKLLHEKLLSHCFLYSLLRYRLLGQLHRVTHRSIRLAIKFHRNAQLFPTLGSELIWLLEDLLMCTVSNSHQTKHWTYGRHCTCNPSDFTETSPYFTSCFILHISFTRNNHLTIKQSPLKKKDVKTTK